MRKDSIQYFTKITFLVIFFLYPWCTAELFGESPRTISFYGASLDVPSGWTETENPTPNERYFISENRTATLNISYYDHPALTSVNTGATYRVTSRFDGWMTLLDRAAKKEELAQSGATDGRVVVYSRDFLSDTGIQQEIVGDYYYFIPPHKIYIVSVETLQSWWPQQQKQFRSVLDSFTIGERRTSLKPAHNKISELVQYTDAFGRTLLGTGPISTRPDTPIRIATESLGSPHSWVTHAHMVYVQFSSHLLAIDTQTNSFLWQFKMSDAPLAPMWLYRGLLYTVRGTRDMATVYALNPDTGGIVSQHPLGATVTKALGHHNQVFFIQNGTGLQLSLDDYTQNILAESAESIFLLTDRLIFSQKNLLIDKQHIPLQHPIHAAVGTANHFYVLSNTPSAIACLSNGALLWHTPLPDYTALSTPTQYGQNIAVLATEKIKKERLILFFNAQTGLLTHKTPLPDALHVLGAAGDGLLVQFLQEGSNTLGTLSLKTGHVYVHSTWPHTWAGAFFFQDKLWLLSVYNDHLYQLKLKIN